MDRKRPRSNEKGEGAVVSVRFSRDDLDRVSDAAKREDMKTSEFIRRSTLGGVARRGRQGSVLGVSGRSGFRGIPEDITVTWRSVHVPSKPEGKRTTFVNETY